jgi:hypothetical protein
MDITGLGTRGNPTAPYNYAAIPYLLILSFTLKMAQQLPLTVEMAEQLAFPLRICRTMTFTLRM